MAQLSLSFTKMQGAGNDFVVINAMQGLDPFFLQPQQIRRLADRRFGVGADQVLVVEPTSIAEADFNYRIFNADGQEVEQCGNGARCFARYVVDQGLAAGPTIRVNTRAGIIVPRLQPDGEVEVNMGCPRLDPQALPFLVEGLAESLRGRQTCYCLAGPDGRALWVGPVSMGNPHLVQWVTGLADHPVEAEGRFLQASPRLPQSVNAGFAERHAADAISLRVYERGAGETLACGSGACAAVVSGIAQQLLKADTPIAVQTRGGMLRLRWSGQDNDPVWMTGPATTVFQGEISL
ncbi:MAG: diaminopimelate epimerase [Pseudomonadota bacterium]|jgi:diaminopimelate epimerase